MKKTIMGFLFSLITVIGFSQVIPVYDGDNFVTKLENGAGVEQNMKFSLRKENYEKIKNSELFKNWETQTWSTPENSGYIEKHKDWDRVILYLNGQIGSCTFTLIHINLKNGGSFKFIEGSKGSIYTDEKGGIRISFPFEAQNGYGNSIVGKTIYTVDMVDGKPKTDCFIYSN